MTTAPLAQSAHHYHDTLPASSASSGTTNAGVPGFDEHERPTYSTQTAEEGFNLPTHSSHSAEGGLTASDLPGRDTTGAALQDQTLPGERTTAAGLASAGQGQSHRFPPSQPEQERGHGLVTAAPAAGVPIGLSTQEATDYSAAQPAPYGERAPGQTVDEPHQGLAGAGGAPVGAEGGAKEEVRGLSENEARRDEGVIALSEGAEPAAGGEEESGASAAAAKERKGAEGAAALGAGVGVAEAEHLDQKEEKEQKAGVAGSRFAESGEGEHAGPKLAKAVEGSRAEKEMRPSHAEATGGEEPGTGDYVPDHSREGVYTAPHGYSHTSAQQPSGLNHLPIASNVRQVPEGGVALNGQEGLPEGKPNVLDRMVGKAQQELGRQKKDWEMYGKGVLREAGGAKAARGEARAQI